MTNILSKRTKAETIALLQALIAGTQKHFPGGSFTLRNVTYTTASLVELLTGLLTALQELNAAQAAAKDALTAKEAAEASVLPVVKTYKGSLLAMFDGSAQTLVDFGLTPPKLPTPRTSAQNAAAAAKAAATREARGTVGPKKRLAIKGNVTGVTVTPVVSSPSPDHPPSLPDFHAPNAVTMASLSMSPSTSAPSGVG